MRLSEIVKIGQVILATEGDMDFIIPSLNDGNKLAEGKFKEPLAIKTYNHKANEAGFERRAIISANNRSLRGGSEIIYTPDILEEIEE